MSLSLTAEQKEIIKIFKIDEQYVIPSYQRPYSWGYDQCFQFYTDLIEKFEVREEYFLGNVIIAKSDSDKDVLQVIDGQQRLTTLLLIIKILSLLNPKMTILIKLLEQEDWQGENTIPRLITNVFEKDDQSAFQKILNYNLEDFKERYSQCTDSKGRVKSKKAENTFELNALYFYSWFVFYTEQNGDLTDFVTYLLRSVYLLPIELSGKTIDEASEKALVIFETINNRGLNLSDADIFKAKLYQKAKNIGEEGLFIKQWVEFKYSCDELQLEIDDAFRFYSHIIRGEQGIISSEIKLREFFVRTDYSPFNNLTYQTIVDQLFKVIEILQFLNLNKNGKSKLMPYLNLIDTYTNQYPRFALVSYLFKNECIIDKRLLDFCESIIRYFYIQGSTTGVKFETYNIIKSIFQEKKIQTYCRNMKISQLSRLGLLKKGYALLAFYLENKIKLDELSVDRIIYAKDYDLVHDSKIGVNGYRDFQELLGNYIVTDLRKKHLPLSRKLDYFAESSISSVRDLSITEVSFNMIQDRDNKMKLSLLNFFSCNDTITEY